MDNQRVTLEANALLGAVLVYAHRYDEAIKQLLTAVDLDPTYWYAHDFLGRAYEQTGRMSEAIAAYQKALDLEKDNAANWSNLGHAYAVSGNQGEAQKIIVHLKGTSAHSYVAPYNVALIYAGLGDKDQAFACSTGPTTNDRACWPYTSAMTLGLIASGGPALR